MPFNGSGVFTPAITLVNGTTAYATDVDTGLSDLAAGLSDCMTRDGQAGATANLSMGGFQLTQLGTASTSDAAVSLGQVRAGIPQSGGEIVGTAGTARSQFFATGTPASYAQRFEFQVTAEAESGSNIGSNLILNAYADNGTAATQVMKITRATGQVDFAAAPTVGGVGVVPAGAMMAFAMKAAPAGWLFCNGASLLRATYPTLFAAIGTTYGVGTDTSGGTTFALPNMQGQFARGFDAGGAVDPGRVFGTSQADQMQTFTTYYQTYYASGSVPAGSGSSAAITNLGSGSSYTAPGGSPNLGAETRPKNIALYYCIKT